MSEYIKREDVYQTLKLVFYVDGCEPSVTEIDVDAFEAIPAADVAEVVHGEWETDRDTIRCSVCGFGYFPHGYFFKDGQCVGDLIFVRCPNCGAKMDGEKEGV